MLNCFITTGQPCALKLVPRPDVFELHVTIDAPGSGQLDRFVQICSGLKVKPLVIQLDDDTPVQPMTCSRVLGSVEAAHSQAYHIQTQIERAGFAVTRVKIEAAPWNSCAPITTADRLKQPESAYFEHHAKLLLPPGANLVELDHICRLFGAHLSRNAYKRREDGQHERFVTLRSHTDGRVSFETMTDTLMAQLKSAGFTIVSSIIEYCVYDSNITLDAAWYQTRNDVACRKER